jgi:cysteine desulfurase
MKVYLDYNSTTPLLDEVKNRIKESLDIFGNPSSMHQFGTIARIELEKARDTFASSLNKTKEDFIFTSSATESNNTVLKGIFFHNLSKSKKTHIITSSIEHPSVMKTCKYLESIGAEITYLPVDSEGFTDLDKLKSSIKKDTSLISIMYANNETGTIQPIDEIGKIAKEHNIPFHSDGAQAFMKTNIDVNQSNIDFFTSAGHKIGAPKGIGALFFNHDKIHLIDPFLNGGGHEQGLRASTENIIHILAFAEAIKTIKAKHRDKLERMKYFTEKLRKGIEQMIPKSKLNGSSSLEHRLPNTLNYSFAGTESQSVMLQLDAVGIAVSTGAACSTANSEASYVLRAMGRDDFTAYSSIRLSTGWQTTEEDIDYVLKKLPEIVKMLRG